MPELPEVETIRLQLQSITNKKISEVIIKDKRVIKDIKAEAFRLAVKNKKIKDVLRRGKVLIVELSDGNSIVLHLRISGWIIIGDGNEKYSRVVFCFSSGVCMSFCDSRVLGEIKLARDWKQVPIIKRMGPDPLELDKKGFLELFSGKKTKIKPLLMDQDFLAGVGNIYAQEALFCAGVHPERNADKITSAEMGKIYQCLVKILKDAIKNRGSSVDTYRAPDGSQDNYQDRLKVYGRQGEPCCKCKNPLKKKSIAGRGTCFCPYCQK